MQKLAAMDWDARYRKGDTPWDKGYPCPGLVDLLESWRPKGRVLVPGCGFGHDASALANANPDAHIEGLDIARSAVSGANRRNRHENCAFRIGDFLDPGSWLERPYDALWEHTLFCAVDRAHRPAYANAISQSVAPGGLFIAIFYMTPDTDDASRPPFGTSKSELNALFGEAFDLEREWIPARSYPGREGRELMRFLRKREQF